VNKPHDDDGDDDDYGTSPISVVSQHKLVSGWRYRNGDHRCPIGLSGLGRTLLVSAARSLFEIVVRYIPLQSLSALVIVYCVL